MVFLLLLLTSLFSPSKLSAEVVTEFYRGTRAMGMGNAFTAVSDDADAVFYNPAGLALNSRTYFTPLNPKFEASKDDFKLYTSAKNSFQKLDASAINGIMNKHIYASGSIFPNIQFPNFILGYYYSGVVKLYARNSVFPQMDATFLVDNGVITGFGYETRGISKKHWLRFGATGKWLMRQGLDRTFTIAEIAASDSTYFKNQIRGPESGWGLGLGIQYESYLSRNSDLVGGWSWQDIGDTKFGAASASSPPSIQSNMAAGLAYKYHFNPNYETKSGITLSGEFRHMLDGEIDPKLKLNFGGEVNLDLKWLGQYSFRAGVNHMALAGGVAWNYFDFLNIEATTYAIENTSVAFRDVERRYMLQLTLKFDLFGKAAKSQKVKDRKYRPRDYR